MKACRNGSLAILVSTFVVAGVALQARAHRPGGPAGYQLLKTVPLPGDGFWDYVGVDSDARRIYVSHATKVLVLDADSFAVVGEIPDTQGVHGIAIASELGRGFTSNGRAGTATIFDLKTLKTIGTVHHRRESRRHRLRRCYQACLHFQWRQQGRYRLRGRRWRRCRHDSFGWKTGIRGG